MATAEEHCRAEENHDWSHGKDTHMQWCLPHAHAPMYEYVIIWIYIYIYLSIPAQTCTEYKYIYTYLSIYISIYLSNYLYICLYLSIYICLSISICFLFCLYIYLYGSASVQLSWLIESTLTHPNPFNKILVVWIGALSLVVPGMCSPRHPVSKGFRAGIRWGSGQATNLHYRSILVSTICAIHSSHNFDWSDTIFIGSKGFVQSLDEEAQRVGWSWAIVVWQLGSI